MTGSTLSRGVPDGCILGPLLFNVCMLLLGQFIKNNNVAYHNFANNTQIYISLSAGDYGPVERMSHCIEQIND